MLTVSVIIPAFNEERNLAQCLRSVIPQVDVGDEVIVVDNASTDLTSAVARSSRVSVIQEHVRGRSTARNTGIRYSKGQILVFLDADCTPASDWLKNLLKPFEDSLVGCVAGQILNEELTGPFGRYLSAKGHLSQENTFRHRFLPYAQAGNAAFRRTALDTIGYFDESLWSGHDADLCWRMQLQTSYKICFCPRAVVYHHQELTPRAFLRQKRRHANGAVLLYKKYQQHRRGEVWSLRKIYWEYRSIMSRGFRYMAQTLISRLGLGSQPSLDQGYQLLIEIGEKIGRIEGSIRNRVWYP